MTTIDPRERLRQMKPTPEWLIHVLTVLRHPAVWVIILLACLFRAAHLDPWNMAVSSIVLVPIIVMLFVLAKRLFRAIEPDTQELPAEARTEPEVHAAIERISANGGVMRRYQRSIINAYLSNRVS